MNFFHSCAWWALFCLQVSSFRSPGQKGDFQKDGFWKKKQKILLSSLIWDFFSSESDVFVWNWAKFRVFSTKCLWVLLLWTYWSKILLVFWLRSASAAVGNIICGLEFFLWQSAVVLCKNVNSQGIQGGGALCSQSMQPSHRREYLRVRWSKKRRKKARPVTSAESLQEALFRSNISSARLLLSERAFH